jgi:hypothetical protein
MVVGMSPLLHTPRLGVLLAGLALVLPGTAPVVGQPVPEQITTDTPAYCLQLFDRVSELVRVATAPPTADIAQLTTEGQRMCDQGQTRGGILRLRRALMLLQQTPPASP